ncbi:MAG: response regulator, partial [Phycisphaerae bacterium]
MVEKVYPNVLVVSADEATTHRVLEAVAARGIRGAVVEDLAGAEDRIAAQKWEMVLVDLPTLGSSAACFIATIRDDCPELPVLVMADDSSIRRAMASLRAGADELLVRPIDRDELDELLEKLLPTHEVSTAAADEEGSRTLYHIVGRSQALRQTL